MREQTRERERERERERKGGHRRPVRKQRDGAMCESIKRSSEKEGKGGGVIRHTWETSAKQELDQTIR